MAEKTWQLEGEYFEACNCDFLCPCLVRDKPTHGGCKVALVFHVQRGRFGEVVLDGLNFVVGAETPGAMSEGNWTVGLILDARADERQLQALETIAAGRAGGPMAGIAALTGRFAGSMVKAIDYSAEGLSRSAAVEGALAVSIAGVPSPRVKDEAMWVENTGHPVSQRLALAKSQQSHLTAFGIDWHDVSGRNNGHYAPFRWNG